MIDSRVARTLVALVIVGVIGACASHSPRYLPADHADDYGYYSTRLGEARYRIVFNGDSRTGVNTARDYALLRAAELTMQEGYDWFEIVDRETATSHSERPGSSVRYEHHQHEETSCGLLGCTRTPRPHARAGMEVDTDRSYTTHSHLLEIVMGKGNLPEDEGNYYEARAVSRSLVESM
ncbi:MAG: hypothetical protein WD448_00570 [Woeseia sp.]